MPPRTAWTQNNSFPSDRIRPSHSVGPPNSKGKGKSKEPPIPKSKKLITLEALHGALRSFTGRDKDPKGGCFCQARDHHLSEYTPICRSCGLILCTLNPPYHACPHCASVLLAAVARDALTKRVAAQISDLIAKEAEERERIAEEARRAVGAFPPLPGGAPASRTGSPGPPTRDHKVVSLNSKTKQVVISTYSTTPPTLSRLASRAPSPEEPEPVRVPPPPPVVHAKTKPDPAHPWANLRGPRVRYVPPTMARIDVEEPEKSIKPRSRQRK